MSNSDRVLSFGQGAELVQKLVNNGLSSEYAQKVIESDMLAKQVVSLIERKKNWVPRKVAEEICSNYLVGLNDARLVGFPVNRDDENDFELVPFSKDELISAMCHGYTLVMIPFYLRAKSLESWFKIEKNSIVDYLFGNSNNPNLRTRRGYFLVKPGLENTGRDTYRQSMEELYDRRRNSFGPFTVLSVIELAYIELVYNLKYGRRMPSHSGLVHTDDILRCSDSITDGKHLSIVCKDGGSGLPTILIMEIDDKDNRGFELQLSAGHYFPVK